jgi:hypothetical protein
MPPLLTFLPPPLDGDVSTLWLALRVVSNADEDSAGLPDALRPPKRLFTAFDELDVFSLLEVAPV